MNREMKNQDQTLMVTTQQMRQIEEEVFTQQMPVASLMEKAALLSSQKFGHRYPKNKYPSVGIVIGCGHNGGDGLVIARELFLHGYQVSLYVPLANKSKTLTAQHLEYAQFLGIDWLKDIQGLENCHVIIDSLFGFGLQRSITGELADNIQTLNQWHKPVVSIDLPSGIETDTGKVLGIAVKATDTLCLGLWKLGLFQESAVEYVGNLHLIDIGIPHQIITKFIDSNSTVELISTQKVKDILPLPRAVNTHKYRQGNALLICGSDKYAGAALLAGYGANSGGVGMLTMIVPASVKSLINSNLPSAVVIGSNETHTGEMDLISLDSLDLARYDVITFGMGISRDVTPSTRQTLQQLLTKDNILIIDADGLNLVAEDNLIPLLSAKPGSTIMTPHDGEFKRLFPDLDLSANRLQALRKASSRANSIILLKGAKTMICDRGKRTWIISEGTPALARGGSGDVLSGLISALVAQGDFSLYPVAEMVAVGAWLHQQAGILAVQDFSEMGVDGVRLTDYISKMLVKMSQSPEL